MKGFKSFGLTLGALLALHSAGAARAAEWTVDPAKSRLGFSGLQTEAPFSGQFGRWSATIDYDPAHPEAGHILAEIDLASARTGDTQRDEALPQADWFDAGKVASATFEATGFRPSDGDVFQTTGKLTLRGISKDVTLPFTLKVDNDQARATGKTKLTRTDFGVGQGPWSTAQWVGLDVDVEVDLVATRKPSP